MLNIQINIDTTQAVESLEAKAEAILNATREELIAQAGNLLAYIKDEKLSGQVLKQRSGNLKRSGFVQEPTSGLDGQYTAYVGFGGTVPYAAIHNYGGTIHIPEVVGKLMVFQVGGETVFTTRHRAFDVEMPERNYLESSAEEREPIIRDGLIAAIEAAIA